MQMIAVFDSYSQHTVLKYIKTNKIFWVKVHQVETNWIYIAGITYPPIRSKTSLPKALHNTKCIAK